MTCSRSTRPCATRTRCWLEVPARARSRSCTSTTGTRAARARRPTRRGSRSAPTQWFDHYVKGERVEGPARRRGADPDLPARRAVRRPVPRLDLGRPQPAARCATRRPPGSHGALELGQPGGLARDRPDHAAGAPAPPRRPPTRPGRPPTVSPPQPAADTRCSARRCVSARFAVTGRDPALAARLWDVAPGGATQTLVARALLPAAPGQRQVFQLHPNGWRFAAGHVPKLELVGKRLPLRPPVELRLVDQGVGPEAPPTGARQAGRRGEEAEAPVQALAAVRAIELAARLGRKPSWQGRRERPCSARERPRTPPSEGLQPPNRSSRSSRAGSAGSARWRTPSAAPS